MNIFLWQVRFFIGIPKSHILKWQIKSIFHKLSLTSALYCRQYWIFQLILHILFKIFLKYILHCQEGWTYPKHLKMLSQIIWHWLYKQIHSPWLQCCGYISVKTFSSDEVSCIWVCNVYLFTCLQCFPAYSAGSYMLHRNILWIKFEK